MRMRFFYYKIMTNGFENGVIYFEIIKYCNEHEYWYFEKIVGGFANVNDSFEGWMDIDEITKYNFENTVITYEN